MSEAVAGRDAEGEPRPAPLAGKRCSGGFRARIPPDVHRALAMPAAEQGISGSRFDVNLMPRALAATTPKGLTTGTRVHLEVHLVARHIDRLAGSIRQVTSPTYW